MLFRCILVGFAFASLSTAAPATVKHAVHERRTSPSSSWVKLERVDSAAILPMRIGLTQTNLKNGHDLLMDVSSPDSPNYSKYWSTDEVNSKFAPTDEAVAEVRKWLVEFGIHDSRVVHSENKGWLAFDATADEAERLLRTEFHEHENLVTAKLAIGCDEYHVPEHLQQHIDYVTPGIKHSAVTKRTINARAKVPPRRPTFQKIDYQPSDAPGASIAATLPAALRNCDRNMTPTCIRALYTIPDGKTATAGNSLGVFEQNDHYAKKDLDSFFATFAPWVPQGTYPLENLIDTHSGNVRPLDELNTGESEIDMDIGTALIYPQTITLYQCDDKYYEKIDGGFNIFLDALDGSYCTYSAYGETGNDPLIDPVYPNPKPGGYKGKLQCGTYKPTKVISISYGTSEKDAPLYYSRRTCDEFMKLALQGHSILISSGDFGVAGYPSETDNGCLGPEGKIFNPGGFLDCPYMTSVGGTMLRSSETIKDDESAMQYDFGGIFSNFTSGGGFSNYFPQPSFQQKAIADYFSRAKLTYPSYAEFEVDFNTTKGLYNRIGRGYPDVAANGAFLPAFIGQHLYHTFGTSLSSPIFASILVLINEERFAIGKGPVGFVNPVLYANPDVLNDIKKGRNLGCGSDGFAAIKGWDPVTGLGTPNYPKMLKLFLSLP